MRYEEDCPLPKLVQTTSHIAFEVKNLARALKGKKVIIEPNSPSEGVVVAFIEVNGAPVELLEFKKVKKQKNGWSRMKNILRRYGVNADCIGVILDFVGDHWFPMMNNNNPSSWKYGNLPRRNLRV